MYTIEELIKAIKKSSSLSQVLRILGLSITGTSYSVLKNKILSNNIDISHFKNQDKLNCNKQKKHYSEFFILKPVGSPRTQAKTLRQALIESGRQYKCEWCGIADRWNGKDITLEVDHIDGNWRNNLQENLRFLCPNCHSQTDNFYKQKTLHYCCDCNKVIHYQSTRCVKCSNFENNKNKRKTNIPNKSILEKEIWELPAIKLAKKYKVSDRTIGLWCKHYSIKTPGYGYWNKKENIVP